LTHRVLILSFIKIWIVKKVVSAVCTALLSTRTVKIIQVADDLLAFTLRDDHHGSPDLRTYCVKKDTANFTRLLMGTLEEKGCELRHVADSPLRTIYLTANLIPHAPSPPPQPFFYIKAAGG